MICNEEDTDGRARVTADEERVLQVRVLIRNRSAYHTLQLALECASWHSLDSFKLLANCTLKSLPGLLSQLLICN